MAFAGLMIGFPLSVEVLFFLLEAIFLGIYLFGRELLRPWLHWACAVPLLIGGFVSMFVVILANSWMNSPTGYTLDGVSKVAGVNVLQQAAFSPAWWAETSHMAVAAFESVGFAFAAVYAFGMLRGRRDESHKKGFFLGMLVVTLAAPLMIFSGDHTARYVANNEPAKLAAMEGDFKTQKGAPLTIYGWPDIEAGETRYGIEIPKLLSILSFDDPNRICQGLKRLPGGPEVRSTPGPPRLQHDGRNRVLPRRRYTLVLDRLVAQTRHPDWQVAPGRRYPIGIPGVPCHRARLDHDRGGSPALGRPGAHADQRGFQLSAGDMGRPRRARSPLPVSLRHAGLAAQTHSGWRPVR